MFSLVLQCWLMLFLLYFCSTQPWLDAHSAKTRKLPHWIYRVDFHRNSLLLHDPHTSQPNTSQPHQASQQQQQQTERPMTKAEKKKNHIKKPLNAFMLYMKEMRAKVVAECTLKESAAINQILGRRVRISAAICSRKIETSVYFKFCMLLFFAYDKICSTLKKMSDHFLIIMTMVHVFQASERYIVTESLHRL